MKKRIALNFKLFFKSPLLVLGFAAAMITPHIMMWERAGKIFAGSDNGVYGLANYMLLYSAVPFLFTALLTYEFVKKSVDTGLWESFESLNSTRGVILSQLPVIGTAAAAVYGMYLSYGVADAVRYADQTAVVWKNLLSAAVLYFLLPGCVAIAMGILFALKMSRPAAYGIFVGWSVVMSPIVGDKIGVVSPKIVFQVREFLNICNSNERWINSLYGIMTEWYRFALVLFWLMLFVGGIVWVLTDQSGRKWIYRAVPMALCVLCCVGWVCKTGYITNDSSATNGTGRLMSNAYLYHVENAGGYPQNREADFTVTQMDLQLDIDNQLKGRATLHVSDLQNREVLLFTLQHSYRIHSITDQNGNKLPWTRVDLDFIEVDISGCDDLQAVTFVYSGVNGQHFAKRAGIMLPGNISYYPVEGWISSFYSQTGLSPSEQTSPIMKYDRKINLTLNTTAKGVAVSLPQTGENTYSGVTNGVSIMAGYTDSYTVPYSDLQVTYPLLAKDFNFKRQSLFNVELARVDEMLGTDYMQQMAQMPVFIYDMSQHGSRDDQLAVVAFSDHVIIKGALTEIPVPSIPGAFAASNSSKAAVGRMISVYLTSYNKDTFLKTYSKEGATDIFGAYYNDIAPVFVQAVGYDTRTRQVDPEKEAAVLKAMGAYLTNENDTRTAEQLMQDLIK